MVVNCGERKLFGPRFNSGQVHQKHIL